MDVGSPAPRLHRLRCTTVLGRRVPIAIGARARLLGLALLDREQAGPGLLIPRCASVHTFGMRFPLDLVFLDERGRVASVRRGVEPRRIASDRRAAAVLELPAVEAFRSDRRQQRVAQPEDQGQRSKPAPQQSLR